MTGIMNGFEQRRLPGDVKRLVHSSAEHVAYAKSTLALDQMATMRALGFDPFAVSGHQTFMSA